MERKKKNHLLRPLACNARDTSEKDNKLSKTVTIRIIELMCMSHSIDQVQSFSLFQQKGKLKTPNKLFGRCRANK